MLTFLGAQVCPLESFHAKVTDDDLSAAVPNLPQVLAVTERLGLQDW